MIETKPGILFVDDDPNVLQGLERTLRPLRRRWNMFFVSGGPEALDQADREPCRVLVCDLCMPGMSGMEVLKHFRDIHPDTVRIVLSGRTDQDAFWQAIGLAHVYLGKPCTKLVLEAILSRALETRKYLPDSSLRRIVSRIEFVPFFPKAWRAMADETDTGAPNMEKISTIVHHDVGMSTKILQIANSAHFGAPDFITNSRKAMRSLSGGGINALVGYYRDLLQSGSLDIPIDWFDTVRQRCLHSALIAERIAKERNKKLEYRDKAFLTGLLHGVGEMVLMVCFPDEYNRAVNKSIRLKIPLWEVEREIFGCTHAEVSAYVLSLWGFPTDICDALAFYPVPLESGRSDFDLLTIVHMAESLARRFGPSKNNKIGDTPDMEYIKKTGYINMLPVWRELSLTLLREMESLGHE